MVKIAVVYHSGYGHTKVQAEAVAEGAKSFEGAEVSLIFAEDHEDHWETLDAADAIIFGSPTYMGSASAPMKAFLDATSSRWMEQKWKDKVAAGFTNSAAWSGDKLNTLVQFAVFAAQHSMIWVTLGLPPGNNTKDGSPEDMNRVGGFLGAMAQSDADAGPDVAPPEADQKTARHLGARVAEITARFVNGGG